MMECIAVNEYVCRVCGYITRTKPYSFPECPSCNPSKIWTSGGTSRKPWIDDNSAKGDIEGIVK